MDHWLVKSPAYLAVTSCSSKRDIGKETDSNTSEANNMNPESAQTVLTQWARGVDE